MPKNCPSAAPEQAAARTSERALLWSLFLLSGLSLHMATDLLAKMRELAFTDHWSQLRLLLACGLMLAIPVALVGGPKARRVLVWSGAVVACLMLLDVTFGGRDPDEAVHLRMAWFMGQGKLPYVDFFTVRNLLWHILCIPLTLLMEDDMRLLVLARVLGLAITLGTFLVLVPICREVRSHPALPFLIVAIPFYPWGAVEFRADPPMTLLLFGSLLAVLKGRPILAGLLSGLAYLMLQKAAFHGIAIGAGILVAGMGIGTLLRYGLTATLISLTPFAIAYATRIGAMYGYCTYGCSAAFASYHQKTPFAKSAVVLVFGLELKAVPLLFLTAALGLVIWWRSGNKSERLLAVCLVLDMVLVMSTKIVFKNYLLFPLMLLGLALGSVYRAAQDKRWSSGVEAALPTVMVLATMLLGVIRWSAFPPTSIALEESRLILNVLPKQETFYGDGMRANLVSPIFRLNPSYYAHDQSAFTAWLKVADFPPPRGTPNDLRPLLANPPGVAVFAENRARLFLDLMRTERGLEYVQILPEVYLRSDLAKKNSVMQGPSGSSPPTPRAE